MKTRMLFMVILVMAFSSLPDETLQNFLENNDYAKAARHIEFITGGEPLNLYYLEILAECYEKLNENKNAFTTYEKIISIDVDNHVHRRKLACHFFNKGDYKESLKFYSQIEKVKGLKVTDYANMVISALKINDKKRAIRYLEQFCLLKPDSFSAFKKLGDLNFELNNYKASRMNYNRALSLNRKLTEDKLIYNNIGDTHLRFAEFKGAIVAYKKALEKDPNNVVLIFKLAFCQEYVGLTNDAIDSFKLLAILDTSKHNLRILGDLHMGVNAQHLAVKFYKEFLKYKENNEVRTYVALHEHHHDNHKEALKHFEKVSIDRKTTLFAAAKSNLICGDYKKAVKYLKSYLEKYPDDIQSSEIYRLLSIATKNLKDG